MPAADGRARNDFIAQASAANDCGVFAGVAERGLAVLDGSSLNLDSHSNGLLQPISGISTSFREDKARGTC
jgi:hypothetical protein